MTLESKYHPRYQARSFSLNYDAAAAPIVSYDASVASAAVIPEGEYRVCATTACWVTEAASPTATVGAGSFYLPANTPIMMQFGGTTKVAAIKHTGGTAGILSLIKTD